MSKLLTRAHRVLLLVVTAVFGLSLLAPMVSLANSDLVAGDQAIVNNPNGTGANLRSDIAVLDDSTLITEVAQGTTITLIEGPIVNDNGTWFRVAVPDGAEGFISAALLQSVDTPAEVASNEITVTETAVTQVTAEETPETPASPDLLWQEPIDVGFVVDDNNEIPAEGLACRTTPTVDGEIVTRVSVNAPLEVVSARIYIGNETFVHINCGAGAGYVNGTYVVIESEQAAAVEEPMATEEPVVTEAPVVTAEPTVVVDAAVTAESTVVTDAVVTEAPTVETPVVPEATVSPETTEAPLVTEESTEEPVVTEVPVVETPVVEEPVVQEPVAGATTEEVTDQPNVTAEATTVVVTDVTATAEATTVTGESTPEVTEEATETATVEPIVTEETVTVTEVATETPADESITVAEATATPTEEAVKTTEAELEATATPPAVTAPASDISKMIGSATVTGTNGEGVRCRVAPSDDAATLMVLAEGTKVYVLSEPTNGYLGIDCGGLQGFADVNLMWAGGAGDEEIQKPSMTVVVTGTGNGLNCRTGAGTSYPVITVLRDGTTITTRAAASNGWVAVVCGGQKGYVATTYVEVGGGSSSTTGTASSSATVGTATVSNTNGDGLRCRSGAGTSYSIITVLAPGAKVTVRGANQGDWTPVSCGANGWVHKAYLTMGSTSGSGSKTPAPAPGTSTGTVTVANTGGGGLNCRSGAGTSFGVITVLRLGQSVSTRSGSVSGWQAVVCGGQNGFVSSQYVTAGSTTTPTAPAPKPTSPTTGTTGQTATVTNTGGDGLYCRSGAGGSYSVITILSPGQTVPVRGATSNGYLPVTCGGKAGWSSAQYLTIGSGSTTPAPTAPKPAPTPAPAPAPAPSGMTSGDHAKTTANLNLRYSASMGAGVAAVAPAGTVVLITGGPSNGFYPVDWDGLRGFMGSDYLAKTSEALSQRGGSADPVTAPPPTSGGGTATGNAMVDYAMRYLGYPYVWATHGPASFDCSGFTYWVTKNVMGKDIGYGTWTQVSAGTQVSRSNLQPGDLVFFQNTYTAGLSHVGLYIGNGKFIHAQNESTGVVISDLDSSYYGPRWYGAVRL